ncbi:dihydroorotase [Alistipes sp. OttesenSCG-928-L06]|nr:dihydroorotase [Alistipes sp. OttesenSCG-928-L06]
MKKILIENAFLVNEHRAENGWVLIEGERIAGTGYGRYAGERPAEVIDAGEKLLLPGVIDDQVHFRQPGLTRKADIHSESVAAVAGGVTSFMEMPNTVPQTTTIDLWEEKCALGAEHSVANYSFYLGATNENRDEIRRIDPRRVPGLKLFMGSSTGNMLVDDPDTLAAIFAESPVLIATHCEDEAIVRRNLAYYKNLYGDRIDPELHPLIRSAEACYVSTARAVELAARYDANLHVLHVSTARELGLFSHAPLAEKKITNEVCVHHLWFSDKDYRRKGNMIKWNPAVKTEDDRQGLLRGIERGTVDVVATDHAPHTLDEKRQPYLDCPSGGPLVQHSLVAMLELYKRGEVTLSHIVEKMCHAPAIRYQVKDRGFIREGYYADLVLVDLSHRWEVETENILYKCRWSPFEGEAFTTRVTHTFIGGKTVYADGVVDTEFRGNALEFDR